MPADGAGPWGGRRFALALLVIVAIGLTIRLVAAFTIDEARVREHGDAGYYHEVATRIGDGYGSTTLDVEGTVQQAQHPPGYTLLLALPSALGLDTVRDHQLIDVAVGIGSVVAIAFLGRRLAGPRAGLLAALLAALYPGLWVHESLVLSETLVVLLVALSLLAVYRFRDQPTLGRAAALGLVTGVLGMTRAELMVLAPAFVIPVALTQVPDWPARIARVGLAGGVVLVLVLPWGVYNLGRFEEPTIMSTQLGVTLAGANCEGSYESYHLGGFEYGCLGDEAPGIEQSMDASERDVVFRERALDFVGDNRGRVPAVVATRLARGLDLRSPADEVSVDRALENRSRAISWVTILGWYVLAILAVIGARVLRRRHEVIWPLVTVVATSVLTMVLFYGSARFRAGTEVVVVVLGAVALDALLPRRVPGSDPDDEDVVQPAITSSEHRSDEVTVPS